MATVFCGGKLVKVRESKAYFDHEGPIYHGLRTPSDWQEETEARYDRIYTALEIQGAKPTPHNRDILVAETFIFTGLSEEEVDRVLHNNLPIREWCQRGRLIDQNDEGEDITVHWFRFEAAVVR